MIQINFRSPRHSDVPEILGLLEQGDMDDGCILSDSEAHEVLEQILQTPGQRPYVAKEGGEIVGMFMLVILQHLSHQGARSAVIEDVVVRADRQGGGIGRQMMAFAADLARDEGCYKLMLSSGMGRPKAHSFYEALGYERHGHSFFLPINREN